MVAARAPALPARPQAQPRGPLQRRHPRLRAGARGGPREPRGHRGHVERAGPPRDVDRREEPTPSQPTAAEVAPRSRRRASPRCSCRRRSSRRSCPRRAPARPTADALAHTSPTQPGVPAASPPWSYELDVPEPEAAGATAPPSRRCRWTRAGRPVAPTTGQMFAASPIAASGSAPLAAPVAPARPSLGRAAVAPETAVEAWRCRAEVAQRPPRARPARHFGAGLRRLALGRGRARLVRGHEDRALARRRPRRAPWCRRWHGRAVRGAAQADARPRGG